jgi:hypothetical protein
VLHLLRGEGEKICCSEVSQVVPGITSGTDGLEASNGSGKRKRLEDGKWTR